MISSNVVLEPKRLQEKVKYLLDQPEFVYDLETTGTYRGEPVANRVVWIGLAAAGETFTVPMGHPNGDKLLQPARRKKNPETRKFDMFPPVWDDPPDQMRPAEVFEILQPLMFNPDIAKIGSGFIFDVLSLAKYYDGQYPVGPYHDTIVQSVLLDENKRYGLKDIVKRIYKRVYDTENVGRKIEIHPFWKAAQYTFLDSRYEWLIHSRQMEEIENEGLRGIYDLEMDVFKVLVDIGVEGTPVDVEEMQRLEKELSEWRVQIEGEVYRRAGKKINLNSNPQKVELFYGKKEDGNQGLKPWRLTKGGLKKQEQGLEITLKDYSTDKEALERFHDNPVVESFLDYQEVDRVLGTYIQGYLGDPDDLKRLPQIFDGKVYPEFVQYGTVTGRFSCRTPNLQNIPRPDTDLGKQIRSLFIAGPEHKLVVADYGQVELVMLAHFVGKGALYRGFFEGVDPHTMTAAMVFNYDPQELVGLVTAGDPEAKRLRQISKNLNFAIVYGAGPDKVAAMSKVKVTQAKKFLRTHERQFPEIYDFKDRALSVCKHRSPPHLTTIMGRRRRVPSIMSRDWGVKGRAERQVFNSLIQGSSADLIKIAMVRLNNALQEEDTGRILLTVHDELVVRCREENADKCAEIVKDAMTGPGIQDLVRVPLSVDLHVVDRWAEAK